jgi:acetoin utilization deacetylase AcuC-like enzyme
VVEQFDPDLTLVSAGYDAHASDPLGGMQLDASAYGWMTRRLLDTLRSPLGFLLEGGYDLTALQDSVRATVKALSETPGPLGGVAPSARHEAEIARAIAAQRAYWKLD